MKPQHSSIQKGVFGKKTCVEDSITRFGLQNDMIKENTLPLYAFLHEFHEQEVSLGQNTYS